MIEEHYCRRCNAEYMIPMLCAYKYLCPECRDYTRKEKYMERAAKRKGIVIGHVDLREIYKRDKGICQICLCIINMGSNQDYYQGLVFDHIIPLFHKGTHCNDNLQLAHRLCNEVKGIKTVQEARFILQGLGFMPVPILNISKESP